MILKRAYDEIMERIQVTEEMRTRILEHLQHASLKPAAKAIPFPALRKYCSIAACFVLLLVGAIALPRLLNPAEPEPPVLTVPDILEAATIQELSDLVGFEVTTDFSLPFEAEETAYCSYWNEMAQIQYTGEAQTATYRQSPGTDDNSGDYSTYSDTVEITVNNRNVTLKGKDGAYVLAIWTDGTYAYSLSISSGISVEDWRTVL